MRLVLPDDGMLRAEHVSVSFHAAAVPDELSVALLTLKSTFAERQRGEVDR